MSKTKFFRNTAIALAVAGPMTAAMATNGYFSHGYGLKAKGMGGASVASTDNAFAGANNPASAAWAGDRVDAGVDLFMPSPRGMDRTNSGPANTSVTSDDNSFYVPEFGYNRAISDKLGVGITVYGNGGMNTNYPGGQYPAGACGAGSPPGNVFCGAGRLGMDLTQLVIAPTVAYKLNDAHSVGVSPLIIKQQFKAYGIPGLPEPGYDSSDGVGVRIGYLGKLTDKLNIGASYSPKTSMSKFSQYKNLFLEQGGFDIPENYTVGASYQMASTVAMALDYQRINYADVKSIGTSSAQGGFGWKSIDVWKLGVEWQAMPNLIMRAGLNVGGNPISSADASMNTLAPGVTTTHYTIGGTYALTKSTEMTVAYMNAPSNSVSGPNPMGGTDTIKMAQQSLGIQFGWKY